jgi:hypothetical protein
VQDDHQEIALARVAVAASESVGKNAASQRAAKLLFDVARKWPRARSDSLLLHGFTTDRRGTLKGAVVEILELDPVTGRKTQLAALVRRALRALNDADVPYAVIGATALAVRGLPRMTKDLDVVVVREDAWQAFDALQEAGFRSVAPANREEAPEPMYVMLRAQGEVDLRVAFAEPESTVVAEARRAKVFGVFAPVATLEHLVLMYLYSNQPRHLGDFARIVTETEVNLPDVERYLAEVHPEMLGVLQGRVRAARNPAAPPARPPRRKR